MRLTSGGAAILRPFKHGRPLLLLLVPGALNELSRGPNIKFQGRDIVLGKVSFVYAGKVVGY